MANIVKQVKYQRQEKRNASHHLLERPSAEALGALYLIDFYFVLVNLGNVSPYNVPLPASLKFSPLEIKHSQSR